MSSICCTFDPGSDTPCMPMLDSTGQPGHVDLFYIDGDEGLEPAFLVYIRLGGSPADAIELRRRFLERWRPSRDPCTDTELKTRIAWLIEHGYSADPPSRLLATVLAYVHPWALVERIRRLELHDWESLEFANDRLSWLRARKTEVQSLIKQVDALRAKLMDESSFAASTPARFASIMVDLRYVLSNVDAPILWSEERSEDARRLERSLYETDVPLRSAVYRRRRRRYYSPLARALNEAGAATWLELVDLLVGEHWLVPLCPTYVAYYHGRVGKLVNKLKQDRYATTA